MSAEADMIMVGYTGRYAELDPSKWPLVYETDEVRNRNCSECFPSTR